jgi:hypothetical protein
MGYIELIQELLTGGAITEGARGQAVMSAALEGHLDVIQELLKEGAIISEEYRGWAISHAEEKGYQEIVVCLRSNLS